MGQLTVIDTILFRYVGVVILPDILSNIYTTISLTEDISAFARPVHCGHLQINNASWKDCFHLTAAL